MKTELAILDDGRYDAWRAAYDDFDRVGMDGSGYFGTPPASPSPGDFRVMVANRLAQADPSTPLDLGMVHCTFRWITTEEEIIGFLAIRHTLNEYLLDQGGHIGYSVRPSHRRRGHALRALGLALPLAASLGVDRVLVTCERDNEASRRTIEANGGVLEDERGRKLRFWI